MCRRGLSAALCTRTRTREQKSLLHGAGIPPRCSQHGFEPRARAQHCSHSPGRNAAPRSWKSRRAIWCGRQFVFQGANSHSVHLWLLQKSPVPCRTVCPIFSPPRLNKSGVFLCCLHWRGWRFRTAELQTWWPSDRFCCVPIFFCALDLI